MIATPYGLISPAEKAGIKVPNDVDNYDPEEYKHFHLFLCAQLGAPMPTSTSHWENAKVIAKIPEDKIKTITAEELEDLGFQVGHSQP